MADLLAEIAAQDAHQFSADPAGIEPVMLVGAATADGSTAVGAFLPVSLARRTLGDALTSNGAVTVWLTDSAGRLLYQFGAPRSEPELVCSNSISRQPA